MKVALNFTTFLFLFVASIAFAKAPVEVTNAIVRVPVVPSVTVTAAFMNLKNNSDKDLKIVGAKGEMAGYFELHTMEMKDGKMKMRTVDSILLKAKTTTKLESGGLHLMIFDLKEKLTANKKYNVTLILDNKEEIKVTLIGQAIKEIH